MTLEKLRHIVVVGAGGNIGSHLLPHLARFPELGILTLIDPDKYDITNIGTQNITYSDLDHYKVDAQAKKVRQINPKVELRKFPLPVASVPLGWLRSDLILACLDSRRARLDVNRAATRLGVSLIDAGVEPGGWLARVSTFGSRHGGPCLECSWDSDDYRLLEQRYSCSGKVASYSTNAPSSLGSLTASIQALETLKYFGEQPQAPPQEVLFDARNHRHFLTQLTTNSSCLNRHQSCEIDHVNLPVKHTTLEELLTSAVAKDRSDQVSIAVEPHQFALRVFCSACGYSRTKWRLFRALGPRDLLCPQCSHELWAPGRDRVHDLTLSLLSARDRLRSLHSYGLRTGDVLTVNNSHFTKQFEIEN